MEGQFKKFSLIPEEPRSVATDGTEFKPEQEQRTAEMKTFEQIKDEVTKSETIIYNTFALAVRELGSSTIARLCDKAAELYASQFKVSAQLRTRE